MAQSVVSAEADATMAWDTARMAMSAAKAVKARAMVEMTDANWWSWQERMKAADRAADKAVRASTEAAQAACRARMAEAA